MKKSIHNYLLLSWGISGCFVLFASFISLFVWTQSQWSQSVEKDKVKLAPISKKLSRQVSGELLLGNKGSSDITIREFLVQHPKLDASIVQGKAPCAFKDNICFLTKDGRLQSFSKIPYIDNDRYLQVSTPTQNFWSLIDSKLILFSLLPLFALVIIGVFIQRFIFRRYILRPIKNLVDVSTGNKETRAHWPVEYKEIGDRLSTAFEKREQAVFGQLAKGVIHDIKTMIHSIMSASHLALQENLSQEDKEKRFKILAKACKTNLPQMQEVIERTLDGSREINVRKNDYNVSQTIKDTLSYFDNYTKNKSVILKTNIQNELIEAPHDKVQLQRALSNVIQNAIDEFDRDESYDKTIMISVNSDSYNLIDLSIEDAGPGFSNPEKDPRLLKSTKPRGSGLGLKIARKIIEAHGGKMMLSKSTSLMGAKVSFQIPSSQHPGVTQ